MVHILWVIPSGQDATRNLQAFIVAISKIKRLMRCFIGLSSVVHDHLHWEVTV